MSKRGMTNVLLAGLTMAATVEDYVPRGKISVVRATPSGIVRERSPKDRTARKERRRRTMARRKRRGFR
jgi:hypothetical protein